MFMPDDLEIGEVKLAFPVPPEFSWGYPLAFGFGQGEGRLLQGKAEALVYIADGEGLLQEGEKNIPLEGDTVLVKRDSERLRVKGQARYLYLITKGAGDLLHDLHLLRPSPSAGIGEKLAAMYLQARQSVPGDIYTASAQVYGLLMELHRLRATQPVTVSGLVREAMDYIQREYAFLSGIEELAGEMGVTASHLVRKFTAETGNTPGKYLQQVRLESARLLLLGREYSVEIIAAMTGFSSANYFCKVFRGRYGVSPGRYREEMRTSAKWDEASRRKLREMDALAQV